MIRALIVDDEYLIRKGMILTISWAKYGIEIIGDTDSGKGALEFLAEHEVDLLLTDITMSNMSGFDLIEQVVLQYPNTFVVVITCHQDFDYLQKALRMGAIDYIVKTELEEEELDENIGRIAQRIQTTMQTMQGMKHVGESNSGKLDYGILLVPSKDVILHNRDAAFLKDDVKFEIGRGMMLYLMNAEKAIGLKSIVLDGGDAIVVGVKNADKVEREKLVELLLEYTGGILPYEYSDSISAYEIDASLDIEHVRTESTRIYQIKKEWSNFKWIFNDIEYERLKAYILSARPDMARLKSVFYKALCELETDLVMTVPDEFYEKLEHARFWANYENLTQELRTYLASKFNCSSYPDETVKVVLNALEYIKANFTEELGQDSIAKMFNISRSYFSKVFKEIVGISFTDYIHDLRMEKAKTMLLKTNMPIFRITREIGFLDEKYFGKVFKQYAGLTPMEYRSQKKK